MQVTLLHHTPLPIAVKAIRKCWASEGNSDTFNTNDNIGEKDKALIDRVGNKNKHASTLEHISYNFDIDGISRACLQELARHRIASLSVKSSRYTLKELKQAKQLLITPDGVAPLSTSNLQIAKDFLVFTNEPIVDMASMTALANLQRIVISGVSNDIAKYCLPEAYKTSLIWTVNMRSLQNFLTLRTNKSALWEIRVLANEIFRQLPEEHKYLFEGCIYEDSA